MKPVVLILAAISTPGTAATTDDFASMVATAIVANRVFGIDTPKLRDYRETGFRAASRAIGAERAFREIAQQASERITNTLDNGKPTTEICRAMRTHMY